MSRIVITLYPGDVGGLLLGAELCVTTSNGDTITLKFDTCGTSGMNIEEEKE